MGGGLSQVCAAETSKPLAVVEFPKFQTGIFVEWKSPWESIQYTSSGCKERQFCKWPFGQAANAVVANFSSCKQSNNQLKYQNSFRPAQGHKQNTNIL